MERVHAAPSWNTQAMGRVATSRWWQQKVRRWQRWRGRGGDGVAAGVEVRPWHRGSIKDHPWHELRHREATTALAVAVGTSSGTEAVLAAAPKHRTLARNREDFVLASY